MKIKLENLQAGDKFRFHPGIKLDESEVECPVCFIDIKPKKCKPLTPEEERDLVLRQFQHALGLWSGHGWGRSFFGPQSAEEFVASLTPEQTTKFAASLMLQHEGSGTAIEEAGR